MPTAVLADLRAALRALRHAPGFTAVAVVTLGGGMALCIVLLTIANVYVLAPLPYPAADRLYSVQYGSPGENHPRGMDTLDWRSLSDIVEEAIAWDLDVFYLRGGAGPTSAGGAWVTPGFMAGFGIRPAIGRGFDRLDFQSGRPQVAMISHRLWLNRFAGDAHVIGRQFEAYVSDRPEEAETFTIVGVLPQGMWHFNPYTEVLAPLRAPTYPYEVRLRSGVTPALAADRITRLVRSGVAVLPTTWRVRLVSMQRSYTARVRAPLRAVGVAAALVLLMACANVAVLQLLRAHRRQREMAVRLALGASAGRLVRLVGIEASIVGLSASAIALIVTILVVTPIVPIVERQLGREVPGGVAAVRIDGRVLAGVAACGLLTTCLCALAPLVVTRRTRAGTVLAGGGRTATEGSGPRRARAVLVAIEVAASLALLTGSMLMIDSVRRMLDVDLGFTSDRVHIAGLGLRQRSYPDFASRARFYEALLPKLQETPGVSSISMVNWWPLQPPHLRRLESDAGGSPRVTRAGTIAVTPDYFATLRIPIRDGRTFSPHDRLGAEPAAVVSRTLAQRLWPNQRAVGQRVRVQHEDSNSPAAGDALPREVFCTVVGVVGDVHHGVADEDLADLYRPLLQEPGRFSFIEVVVRDETLGWEGAIQRAVSSIDRDTSVGVARRLDAAVDLERARPRFLASLLAAFALPAGLIALIGLHGAIAYSIRQREREIAIRLALGAEGSSIVRLFVGQGAAMLTGGLGLGLLAALSMGQLLQNELFGVRPAEPHVLAVTAVALAGCGLAAIASPARRAARTDPAVALRNE